MNSKEQGELGFLEFATSRLYAQGGRWKLQKRLQREALWSSSPSPGFAIAKLFVCRTPSSTRK